MLLLLKIPLKSVKVHKKGRGGRGRLEIMTLMCLHACMWLCSTLRVFCEYLRVVTFQCRCCWIPYNTHTHVQLCAPRNR